MERIVQIHVEYVETPYPVTALMVYAKMDVIRAGNQLINVTSDVVHKTCDSFSPTSVSRVSLRYV